MDEIESRTFEKSDLCLSVLQRNVLLPIKWLHQILPPLGIVHILFRDQQLAHLVAILGEHLVVHEHELALAHRGRRLLPGGVLRTLGQSQLPYAHADGAGSVQLHRDGRLRQADLDGRGGGEPVGGVGPECADALGLRFLDGGADYGLLLLSEESVVARVGIESEDGDARPVDVEVLFEREGRIGKLYDYFYTTVGNGTAVANAKKFAAEYAQKLKQAGVNAVIMTST